MTKKNLQYFCGLLMMTIIASSADAALAEDLSKLVRIGGNFTITKIVRIPSGGFSVDFTASEGKPKISHLHLQSDHINAGLSEGSTLRLSADVVSSKNETAEISQVVVFLKGRVGPTPVWMLSNKVTNLNPPARLIEMHAPSTDYQVF